MFAHVLGAPRDVAAATTFGVQITNCSSGVCFTPATVTGVAPGDSVSWTNMTTVHLAITRCTVATCAGQGPGTGTDDVGSQSLGKHATYTHVFSSSSPGTYFYGCVEYPKAPQPPRSCPGAPRGEIVVSGSPTPAPTPKPTPVSFSVGKPAPTPRPTSAPTPVPTAAAPSETSTPVALVISPAPVTPSPSSAAIPIVSATSTGSGSHAVLIVIVVVLIALAGGAAALVYRRRRTLARE